jgi:hypothetical protein
VGYESYMKAIFGLYFSYFKSSSYDCRPIPEIVVRPS